VLDYHRPIVPSSRFRHGVSARLLALAAVVALPTPAVWSFPPYRSTDAETAEPGTLELRLGLLRVEREDHDDTYSTPLLRTNLGLVGNLELVSELEYRPEEGHLTDGAVGLKGVTPWGPLHVGIEALALLPVSSEQSGVGVESQLLGTWRRAPLRLHGNAGGFYDPRSARIERGWRASLLAELESGHGRAGLEVFAKQIHGESVAVQAGPGVIFAVGPADLRSAVHVGVSREAPDLVVSLWIAWSGRVWEPRAGGGQRPRDDAP